MMALNFVDEGHERMLRARTKDCTVRMGDVSALYPQGSVVYITVGAKGEPKHRLYTAYLDKVRIKTMGTLTKKDLEHQNPEIKTKEHLLEDFERIYKRVLQPEDVVTVIYFTEILEDE